MCVGASGPKTVGATHSVGVLPMCCWGAFASGLKTVGATHSVTLRGCVADVVPGFVLCPVEVDHCGRNIWAVARMIQQVKVICAHLVHRLEGEKLVLHAKVQ